MSLWPLAAFHLIVSLCFCILNQMCTPPANNSGTSVQLSHSLMGSLLYRVCSNPSFCKKRKSLQNILKCKQSLSVIVCLGLTDKTYSGFGFTVCWMETVGDCFVLESPFDYNCLCVSWKSGIMYVDWVHFLSAAMRILYKLCHNSEGPQHDVTCCMSLFMDALLSACLSV